MADCSLDTLSRLKGIETCHLARSEGLAVPIPLDTLADAHVQFPDIGGNPKPYVVTIEAGEDAAVFAVPRPIYKAFDSGGNSKARRRIRCSIDREKSQVGADPSTGIVTVSDHSLSGERTFHTIVAKMLEEVPTVGDGNEGNQKIPRVDTVASALFNIILGVIAIVFGYAFPFEGN